MHFCRQPPPHPRLRRSSPAPIGCVGSARAYIRGAAVSGVEPVGSRIRLFSRISPCTGPWGYRHGGWGRRGGGTSSPSPVSHAPELCTSHRSSPPAFLRGMPVRFCRHPHPARAFGAPPPPPPRGRGQCVAISGGQPYPALLQDLPMLWTVRISPRGVGPTGRGNSFPLPCLSRSRHLAPCQPYPARPSVGRLPVRSLPAPSPLIQHSHRGYPYALCRPPPLSSSTLTGDTHTLSAGNPHPARAFGAPPPPPPGGRVRAWRYQGSNRIRGGTGGQPCSALLQDLPMCWTVGNIATGGGGLRGGSLREGGTRSPSPVSRAQNALLLRHPHLPEGGQRPADLMHPASPGAQGSAARRSAGGYPLKKARTGRVTPQSLPLLPQPQGPRDLPLLPPGAGTSLS